MTKTDHIPQIDNLVDGEELPENIEIIQRGKDEYIILDGRLLTYYGAPVGGSESATYHALENVVRAEEHGLDFTRHLWPLKAGLFSSDDMVDLYCAIQRERAQV